MQQPAEHGAPAVPTLLRSELQQVLLQVFMRVQWLYIIYWAPAAVLRKQLQFMLPRLLYLAAVPFV